MEYRTLGRTGLELSRIALGCGNFGGIGSDPRFFGMGEDEEEAFALMDHAWEMGVIIFDTADAYGGGRSETTIGRWLRTKEPRVRDRLLLSSKVGSPVSDDPNDRGLSARHIKRQVDRSLERLGVNQLAMYLIHQPDPATPMEETLSALDDVVRAGKVRAIGASNIEAPCLADALLFSERQGLARFEWVQNRKNERWQLEEVDRKLRQLMTAAYDAAEEAGKRFDLGQDTRTAAYLVALGRMQRAYQERGIFP